MFAQGECISGRLHCRRNGTNHRWLDIALTLTHRGVEVRKTFKFYGDR